MKIIRRGQRDSEKMYRGHCSNCGTVFECQKHEGKPTATGQAITVRCPVCTVNVTAFIRNDGDFIREYDRPWMTSVERQIADYEERGPYLR